MPRYRNPASNVRLCQDVRNCAVHQMILLECKSSLCIRKLCKILTAYMIHHLDTVNATADRSAWGPAVSLQCSFHISCSKIYIQQPLDKRLAVISPSDEVLDSSQSNFMWPHRQVTELGPWRRSSVKCCRQHKINGGAAMM